MMNSLTKKNYNSAIEYPPSRHPGINSPPS